MYKYTIIQISEFDITNVPERDKLSYEGVTVLSFLDERNIEGLIKAYKLRHPNCGDNPNLIILDHTGTNAASFSENTILQMFGKNPTTEQIYKYARVFNNRMTFSLSLPDNVIEKILPENFAKTITRRNVTVELKV